MIQVDVMADQAAVGRRLDLKELAHRYQTTFTFVISDDYESVQDLLVDAPKPLLLSSWKKATLEKMEAAQTGGDVHPLTHEIHMGVNALSQIREVLFATYNEGYFSSTERVLVVCRIRDALELVFFFDMSKDESVTRLKKELEYRADPRVIESLLQLASEIAREGRERGHVGALFVIGDTDRVLEMSRQMVINPFKGHSRDERNLLTGETWETAKEFSQIDGAFIVRETGIIEAAGRFIEVKDPVSLPSGFGGRHLAAAHVTKETKAIAITVSETGVIRVFKDGEILMRIGNT
jgi:DNA integrity scanning protein DisA with diadenylate cyclase activity